MKAKLTLAATVGLCAPLASAQPNMSNAPNEQKVQQEKPADQIEGKLSIRQKRDLLRMIELTGAKVDDWTKYSSSMAPSKCGVSNT